MSQVHHFEVTTQNLFQRVLQLRTKLGFQVFAHATDTHSNSNTVSAIALHLNSIIVIVQSVKRFIQLYLGEQMSDLPGDSDWVSNVTWLMVSSEFKKTCTRVFKHGNVTVINCMNLDCLSYSGKRISSVESPKTIDCVKTVSNSKNKMFTLLSPFSGVYHTVMDGHCDCSSLMDSPCFNTSNDSLFSDTCLPGFTLCPLLVGQQCLVCDPFAVPIGFTVQRPLWTHIDHITFACNTSSSSHLLQW